MAITKNSQIDLNGNEMILDADGDTTITADTDDQIDIKVAGTDRITIDASGDVLIGTTTINSGTLGTSNKFLEVSAGTASGSGTLILSRNTSTNDVELGGVRFVNANNADDDGLDADGKLVAAVSARSVTSDSNAGDDSGANLIFYTKPEAGNYAERMRISSSGNVGIGDSNPGAKLDVNSGTTNTLAHFHSTDDNAFIELKDDDTTGYIGVQNDYVYVGGAPSTTDQNIVIHKTSGNVGISWAAPTARLGILQNGSTTPGMNITDGASADFRVFAGYVSGTTRIGTSAGNLAIDTGGTERMRIQSGGNVLLNQTATADSGVADGRLEITRASQHCINCHVAGTGNSTLVAFINDNGFVGGINTNGSATVYNTSSDARLKNVLGDAKGLEVINALNAVNFEWKSDGKIQDGLIAQQVEKVFPDAVSEPELEGEWYSIDYSKLVTPLIKGMQEQQAQIEALQSEINTLKGG